MSKSLIADFLSHATATEPAHDPKTHYKFDGKTNTGYIELSGVEDKPQPAQYEDILRRVGLDPEEFRITQVKNFSGWQQTTDGPFLHAYRLNIEPISSVDHLDLDDLYAAAEKMVKKIKKPKQQKKTRDDVRVLHIGDLQIGKIENGEKGISGLLERYIATIQDFIPTIEPGQPVLVAHVGDCVEGNQSQKGKNMGYQTPLTITEQARVYRRLLIHTVKELAPHTPELVIGVVNGNHDESDRRINTKFGDGWATESAIAVADMFEEMPGFEHVKIVVPQDTRGHFTVDVNGTRFLLMHGHQFPRPGGVLGAEKWLRDAAFYQHSAAAADFVLFGHFHTFQMANQGPHTFVCSSTYDGGSCWFAEVRGGAWQLPYGTAFTARGQLWSGMRPI